MSGGGTGRGKKEGQGGGKKRDRVGAKEGRKTG
jgi:hypothetical protein